MSILTKTLTLGVAVGLLFTTSVASFAWETDKIDHSLVQHAGFSVEFGTPQFGDLEFEFGDEDDDYDDYHDYDDDDDDDDYDYGDDDDDDDEWFIH